MSVITLVNELQKLITPLVDDFLMESSEINNKPRTTPSVAKYYLSPKQSNPEANAKPDYPLIIIRPVSNSESDSDPPIANCQVDILVFTTSRDVDERVEWCINLITRISQHLKAHRIVGERYRLDLPLEWELFDDSQKPNFAAALSTKWEYQAAGEEINYDKI